MLPFVPMSFNWSLLLRFPIKAQNAPLHFPIRTTRTAFSFFLIRSLAKYLVMNANHEALHYANSSNLLFPQPYQAQTSSSAPHWARIIYFTLSYSFNPLTPELNPPRNAAWWDFVLGILLLELCILLMFSWNTKKCNNYSFSLLIMYCISYMFRHYIAIIRERS
jgi:hypothetical protein